MTARSFIVTGIAGLLVPAFLSAQTIRGEVVDVANSAPIAGVVVVLLDSAGNQVARALTGDAGEYRLTAPTAGSYRLRTLRIGLRPVTSDAFSVVGDAEVTKRLEVASVTFSLDTVRVAGKNACQVRPDSAAITYSIWEQARTALTSAQLTARLRTIGATVVTYQRSLDPEHERVIQQSSTIMSGLTTRPWTSRSALELRRGGYVMTDAGGTTIYFAPDLAVLSSDAFIEDHCLKLASGSDRSRVGMDFEPTRERKNVPDIRGTLWLDRNSSELRRLEFRYANVTREQGWASAGGYMEFARMKDGAWAISRWSIRMPVLVTRQGAYTAMGSSGAASETRVGAVRVEGGELALVTRGSDTLWSRPPLSIAGRVIDSTSGSGLADTRVSVRGTPLVSTSDADGRFRIANVLPGAYTLEIRTPSLVSLGTAHAVPIVFADSAAMFTIRVPTSEQIVAPLCGSKKGGIIAGSVRMPGDTAVPRSALVVAEWVELYVQGPTTVAKRNRWLETRTDSRGAFRICGAPINTALIVRAESDSGSSEPMDVRIPPDARLASVVLIMEKRAAGTAILTGVILSDVNAQGLPDVEVLLPELSKNGFTDESGAFRIRDIPAGTHVVEIRRIGFKALSDSMTFAANQTIERRTLLSRVPALDTVSVTAAVIPSFEEHRRLGFGHFLTRLELEKQGQRRLSDILETIPGLWVVRGTGNHAWISSGRPRIGNANNGTAVEMIDALAGAKSGTCYSQVYLDNHLVYGGRPSRPGGVPERLFDINILFAEQIEAIEYYSDAMQAPTKYNTMDSNCGVLVLHTRRQSKDGK